MTGQRSDFERIGEAQLRAIMKEFVGRVMRDPMIGFLFRDIEADLLEQREFEFTARFLGARHIEYSGRPLQQAHARHRIFGGQFARRTKILKDVLTHFNVDASIQQDWLEHVEKLRPLITTQADHVCQEED